MGKITLLGAGGAGVAPVFSPLDISNLKAWYKADAGVTLNGSTVSQWDDMSGSGNHAIQATAINQPTYTGGASPYLTWDGVNDKLRLNAVLSCPNITYFIVFNRNADTTQYILSAGPSNINYAFSSTAAYLGYNNTPCTLVTDERTLIGGRGQTDLAEFYKNGVNYADIINGDEGFNIFQEIGSTTAGYPANCDIYEILIYTSILSDTEVNEVNAYLNSKYSIY